MSSTMKNFKARALARPGVKQAYDDISEEFAFLDEVLKARVDAGLTQAEVARRIGTTQSAIARLESSALKHSPTLATLRRYAEALGYSLQVRLVKKRTRDLPKHSRVDVRSLRGSIPGICTDVPRDPDRV